MKKAGTVFGRIYMALIMLFLYAPILVLIVFSFNASNSRSLFTGFSTQWYVELFHDSMVLESLYTTLAVSLLAALAATLLGTFASIGFYAMKKRWREPLLAVNNIPMMNADIVTGVSLCLLFVAVGRFLGFKNGFGTLLIAHITFNVPYVILSVMPKLRQLDRHLVDAAQDLGCTWMQAFWKVIVPEIRPGIVNGALMAFTMSIDDFIISYFTAGTGAQTLAVTIYSMTKKRVTPEINALSSLLFLTVLVLLLIVNIRSAQQEKKRLKAERALRRTSN